MVEELKQRRARLEHENRLLRTEKVVGIAEKSALQDQFIECLRDVKRDTLKRRFVSRERLPGMEATTTSFHPNSEDEYAQDKQKILDIIVANEEFTHFLFELVFGSGA